MSPFNENLAEKYGLTGEKLQQFHKTLEKLYEDYKKDKGEYAFLHDGFLNIIAEFNINQDKVASLIKELYESSAYRDLIREFSMAVAIYGDFQDKYFNTCKRIMRFEYDDSDDRDVEAKTPWDLKDL